MEEIWKPVNDYPGYFVSNTGKVKSYHNNRVIELLPREE